MLVVLVELMMVTNVMIAIVGDGAGDSNLMALLMVSHNMVVVVVVSVVMLVVLLVMVQVLAIMSHNTYKYIPW